MNARFIKSSEKKEILNELNEYYGVSKLPYLLIETGRQRIRAFSGSLSKEEILKLSRHANIEIIGLYLASKRDDDIRLNFDAVSLLKDQIKENIVEIDEKQLALWIRGFDLDIKYKRGPVVIKYKDEIVGVGKSNEEKLFNYIPKERKVRTPVPSL